MEAFMEAKNETAEKFELVMHHIQSVDKICQIFIDKPDCFQLDNLNVFRDDFKILMEKLQREIKSLNVNKIKVSCFGRTSNGKSTLMNAILSKELIPTGLGQTTSCFISIEGSDSDELSAVLTTEGGEEIECDIKSIHDLSSAFSDSKTSFGSIIRIKYPKKLCPLLDSDIILYDSPGIDDSDVSDYYIKKYCLDSDIFFYVCNSESSLMKIEKEFFLSVYKKIAKPNIFVLFNRWDQCIDSKDSELLIKQHREKISELQYQLKQADSSSLDDMIYFISSKHSLDSKISGNFDDGSVLNNNFKQFEDYLSQTIKSDSISTKFARHWYSLMDICRQFLNSIGCILEEIHLTLNAMDIDNKQIKSKLMAIESEMHDLEIHSAAFLDKVDLQINDLLSFLESTCVSLINDLIKSDIEFQNQSSDYCQTKLKEISGKLISKLENYIDSGSYSFLFEKIKGEFNDLNQFLSFLRNKYDGDSFALITLESVIFGKRDYQKRSVSQLFDDFVPDTEIINIFALSKWIISLSNRSNFMPSGSSISTVLLSILLLKKSEKQAIILLCILSASSIGYDFSKWSKNFKSSQTKNQAMNYLKPKVRHLTSEIVTEKHVTLCNFILDYKAKFCSLLSERRKEFTQKIAKRVIDIDAIKAHEAELIEIRNLF